MPRFPQAKANVRVPSLEIRAAVVDEVERLNAELAGRGRVLVRPSGTEPVVRVLAEAERAEEAADLCGSIADLVRQEAGPGKSRCKAVASGRTRAPGRKESRDVRDHRIRRAA